MKKVLLLSLTFSLLVLAFSFRNEAIAISSTCSVAKTTFYEVNVNNRYSINVPDYLTRDSTLNNEASLQYSNINREVYIIIIDEPKQDFIDVFKETEEYDVTKSVLQNYSRVQMESIKGNMSTVTTESKLRNAKTHSGNALVANVSGFQDGIDDAMGFKVGFVEGKLNLYMILTWTFASTFPKYDSDMDKMIKSFRELSGALDTYPYCVTSGSMFVRIPNDVYYDTIYPDASLYYASDERDLHFMVIESPISEWDSAYGANAAPGQSMLEYVTEVQVEECKKNLINVHDAGKIQSGSGFGKTFKSFTLVGQPHNSELEMHYKLRVLQGSRTFYLLQSWTPVSRRDANEKDMDLMLNSFNEL